MALVACAIIHLDEHIYSIIFVQLCLMHVRYGKLNWSHRYSVHVEANIALHFEANITVLEAHRSFDKPLLVC